MPPGGRLRRVGVNWDITESKDAELARQQATVAEREIQAKSQFLSRMSHELRTPLNAVLGFTQLLQIEARQAGQPGQLAMLGHVRAAGEHLLSLINDVLDLSGVEAGELKLALQPVDLGALARQSVPLIESLAAQQGVMVEVADPCEGVAVADPTRLRQVLINLLSNAIKYNRAHGRVFVRARVEGEQAVLSVRDTGRGLDADQLGRLFEPFNRFGAEIEGHRRHGHRPDDRQGTGRGHGRHDRRDQPARRGNDLRGPPAASAPRPRPSRRRRRRYGPDDTRPGELPRVRSGQILYIEDNPVNVLLVEELVKSVSGLRIASEATGAAASPGRAALKPDLVLDRPAAARLRRLRGAAPPARRSRTALDSVHRALGQRDARGRRARSRRGLCRLLDEADRLHELPRRAEEDLPRRADSRAGLIAATARPAARSSPRPGRAASASAPASPPGRGRRGRRARLDRIAGRIDEARPGAPASAGSNGSPASTNASKPSASSTSAQR